MVTRWLVVEYTDRQLGETVFTSKHVGRFGVLEAENPDAARDLARLQWHTQNPLDVLHLDRLPAGWFYV